MCSRRSSGGIVAAAGRLELQEGAQLDGRPPVSVEGAAGARAARGPQQVGEVVPEQVAQPPLGDAGQVDVAHPAREQHPEVLGLEEPGLLAWAGVK